MKKIICLVIATFLLLSTNTFAATYYDINVEGLTAAEKRELVEWLEDEGYEYDIESYSSADDDYNQRVITVEKLSSSEKNTLVNWLNNRDYEYTSKIKNGYYYITIEYTSSTKNELTDYLDYKEYYYDVSYSSSSLDRTGKAYLVANGYLWYADGDDIDKVDTIYSPEYVLFTANGGISYINESNQGKVIYDIDDPTDSEKVATSVKSISKNSSGYATSFKSLSKTTKIEVDDDFDNDDVTVYVVRNNTLYSLSPKNKLTTLKSLKSISSSYSNRSNIGFSEWGDLVIIDSSTVLKYNEEIDNTDEFENLKNQNGYTVQAQYFTVKNGIIQTVTLKNGSIVKLEKE